MRDASPLAEVASVTQRLAVLLAAGVAPASAWRYVAGAASTPVAALVAAESDPSRIAHALALAIDGVPKLEADGWRGLAAAWSVATDAGAPLAPSLRAYAASLRDLAQAQRDVRIALAGPIATARLVMILPAIGVLFGMALGFNTAQTLVATPVGLVCLASGIILILAASRWNRRLVAAAQPTRAAPGIECDLMAIAVSGGGSLEKARTVVDDAIRQFGLDAASGQIDGVLELSQRAGVPAAELLHSEADELRRRARAEAQTKAAVLGVRLMLPLGLCILPAFMALGVFPLIVTVVSSTVGTF